MLFGYVQRSKTVHVYAGDFSCLITVETKRIEVHSAQWINSAVKNLSQSPATEMEWVSTKKKLISEPHYWLTSEMSIKDYERNHSSGIRQRMQNSISRTKDYVDESEILNGTILAYFERSATTVLLILLLLCQMCRDSQYRLHHSNPIINQRDCLGLVCNAIDTLRWREIANV